MVQLVTKPCPHRWGKWRPLYRDPTYKRVRTWPKCLARQLGTDPMPGVRYRELVEDALPPAPPDVGAGHAFEALEDPPEEHEEETML